VNKKTIFKKLAQKKHKSDPSLDKKIEKIREEIKQTEIEFKQKPLKESMMLIYNTYLIWFIKIFSGMSY
jgi:hypothetical protein